MGLNKGKHIVEEIEGVRCTVVEKGVDKGRLAFLKDILDFNGYEVKVQEEKAAEEGAPVTYVIGVTDLVFNPVIAVYEMALKTRDGRNVSPAYWNQYTDKIDDRYWYYKKDKK